MRIIRYVDSSGEIHHGAQQEDGSAIELSGDLYSGLVPTGRQADARKLLAPLVPTSVLGIGLNYRRHAQEAGASIGQFPIMFVKGVNTVQHPEEPIVIPAALPSDEVDYECELAVVIGKSCKNVSPEEALDYVLGYTCANDVSARDWQLRKGGGQWCRGKFFDTFCPLGPCLVTPGDGPDEIPDPHQLRIRTILNDQTVQDWSTGDMIFGIRDLIAFLSGSTTLLPGTVILTGTPHGVGMAANPPRWLRPDDQVTVEIERIGRLSNPVALETEGIPSPITVA